jgi:DNA polymerase II small subunit/DNA polymerase delta subunit B
VAHELHELIPEWISIDALCYHRILFTQIPGNHDALEACLPVDAARRKKDTEGKKSLIRKRK